MYYDPFDYFDYRKERYCEALTWQQGDIIAVDGAGRPPHEWIVADMNKHSDETFIVLYSSDLKKYATVNCYLFATNARKIGTVPKWKFWIWRRINNRSKG